MDNYFSIKWQIICKCLIGEEIDENEYLWRPNSLITKNPNWFPKDY